MGATPMWRRYLRLLGRDIEGDVEDELSFHLEMRAREYEARGMAPAAAREAAMRRFGNVESVRREVKAVDASVERERRAREWWSGVWQDVRYAGRTLRRSPGFTAVAVVTLGLGIGASTAIYSVLESVVLRPLPYPEAGRVVQLVNSWEGTPEGKLSPPEYFDYRDRLRSLESLGVYATGPANLTGGEQPERVEAAYVTRGVLEALRVPPALGRGFTAEEDQPGGERVVLLSDGLWRRRYSESSSVLGERILVNGRPAVVVGVMPPEFRLPLELDTGTEVELLAPLAIDRSTMPNRGSHFLHSVGRLREGVSVEAASRELAEVAAGFTSEFPEDYPAEMRFGAGVVEVREAVLGSARPVLLLLLGAVSLLLLIACANVANLLLVRGEGRRRELAVRAALGASGTRLGRQLLVESLVLAGLGVVLGMAIAFLVVRGLPLVQPPHLPRLDEVGVSGGALGFAVAVGLVTALLFGIAPIVHAPRAGLAGALRAGGRGSTGDGGRGRLRSVLVVGQVATAVVLLLGAGLMIRSLVALYGVDPGFDARGVLTFRLALPQADYPGDEEVRRFFSTALGELREMPGVTAAGAVSNLPLASSLGDLNFHIDGREVAEGETSPRADWQVVTPGYFEAVGMTVLRGRGIEPRDDTRAPGVIVLNESLAERYWPGEDPIGRRLRLGGGAGPGWVTVIGIVRDVRHAALTEPPAPEMYIPHAQFTFWGGGAAVRSLTVALRTPGEPSTLVPPVRSTVRRLDPNLPLADVRPLAEVRSASVAQPRFLGVLMGGFATIALVLAAVGLYGTLAYLVSQRTNEIGVRMALGAEGGRVATMFVRRGAALALAGVAIGMAAALGVTRLLEHLLFHVEATDPATFVAAPAALLLVALLASYVPARRATRVDPLVALRAD